MHPPAPVPQGHEPFGPGHERVGVGVGVRFDRRKSCGQGRRVKELK